MSDEFEQILNDLRNRKPFALTRWGDGEWCNIDKVIGTNCDGSFYYSDLGDRLLEIVSEKQDYYMASFDRKTPDADVNFSKYPQEWISANVLHRASIDGKLDIFVEAISNLNVFYVGNKHLKNMSFINNFLTIPEKNVWKFKDTVMKHIKENIVDNESKVFLFSAGMASNVFIHDLWNYNKNNTYIDVGSVFDPYVGRFTRQYHKKVYERHIRGKLKYVKD